jgi:hypothetical protein
VIVLHSVLELVVGWGLELITDKLLSYSVCGCGMQNTSES